MQHKELMALIQGEFWERGLPGLTPREATAPRIRGKVLAIVGMRRTGKTFFVFQQIRDLLEAGVPRDSILYLNLEDDRLLPVGKGMLAGLIEAFYALHPENHKRQVHLFLDEIQNAEGWPSVLRRFLDTRTVQITITGSSAKLLGKEIATSLRGRSLACEIGPFSFTERLRYLGMDLPGGITGPAARDRLARELLLCLTAGGFPETIDMQPRERIQMLQDYVHVVILRDIVERHSIANVSLIRYLIRTLMTSAGGRFTVNKFFNDLKSQGIPVAKNTLHDFLGYIEDAFLAFLIPIHSRSARKRQVNPRKVYAVDPGLAHAFALKAENFGPLFENQVYVDLRRRGCEVAYHLTRSGAEVDFVASYPGGRTKLYQAAFDISDRATRERELAALEEARKELGVEGMLITPETYISDFLGEAW